MLSTFRSKEEFLAAVTSQLDGANISRDVSAALVSGISSADDVLRSQTDDRESLALNLKVGSWVIRDDDLPLFQAINTTGAAIALTMTTGGLAWPAIAAALAAFADLCWRAWRKGARLSSLQVSAYGALQAHGPMKEDAVIGHLKDEQAGGPAPEVVKAVLESLREVDADDGHLLALAARDGNGVWKALRI